MSLRLFGAHCPILLALLTLLAPGQDPPSGDDLIRVDVNLVTIRFTVRTLSGSFENSLSQEDFRVIENGQEREILFFQPPRSQNTRSKPLWLAFLLDVSGSTFATRAEEILAARSFFENIHDFTQVGIYGFSDQVFVFQEFTSDKSLALQAFGSARKHLGQTALYDSVNTLVETLASRAGPDDRKALIIVSDGIDAAYRRAASAIARARQNDVTIYTIWVPSTAQLYITPTAGTVRDPDPHRKEQEAAFARLSQETGGSHFGGFEAILDFDNVLAQINDELFGNLYTLGYYTDQPDLRRWERQVEVLARPAGLTVGGQVTDAPQQLQAKKAFIAALFESGSLRQLAAGVPWDIREIGAELDLLHRNQRESGLPFRIKVNPHSLRRSRNGDLRTQLGVIGLLIDSQGQEVVRLREVFRASLNAGEIRDGRGVIYRNRLQASPGSYLLRIALLEIPTWRMTLFEDQVVIR